MQLKQKLIDGAEKLNITMNNEQAEKFIIYMELLLEYNKHINLTAITDKEEIIIKHFLDSLIPMSILNFKDNKNVIDIGTGAGFPSIPLKIMLPNVNFVLLDSLNKRINFLNEVIKTLNLKNIKTVHGRSEDYGQNDMYREKFDFAVSRAVANLTVLSEFCLPFVKVGGNLLALKGKGAKKEVNESLYAINTLGGKILNVEKVELPYTSIQREIVFINKISETPKKYPRKAGKVTKKPLM